MPEIIILSASISDAKPFGNIRNLTTMCLIIGPIMHFQPEKVERVNLLCFEDLYSFFSFFLFFFNFLKEPNVFYLKWNRKQRGEKEKKPVGPMDLSICVNVWLLNTSVPIRSLALRNFFFLSKWLLYKGINQCGCVALRIYIRINSRILT